MTGQQRNPLSRATRLIRFMAENGDAGRSWGVRELATHLDIPPSGVHRLITALEADGWIEADPRGTGYRIGLDLFRLSFLISAQLPLHRIAQPVMEDLVRECNETVLLGVLNPATLKMIFAAVVESQHPLRYVVELNRWIPIHLASSGLAIMAFLSEEQREIVLTRDALASATERTITDPDAIRAEIGRIRAQGYAISRGQRLKDAVGIAAPIFGPDGAVLGDLCITIPEQRFASVGDEQRLAQSVMRRCREISAIMSSRQDHSDDRSK